MSETGEKASAPPSSGRPARATPGLRRVRLKRWLRLNVHFVVAAGVLLVVGGGWNGIMAALKWTMTKSPVPWPEGTEVAEHRLANFPEKLGPYLIVPDGEMSRQPDGRPDGIVEFRKEDLDTLGVLKHKLNWYFAGVFQDVRTRGEAAWKGKHYVRLDVTYYTGLLDAVPHIPDVCLGAGGFTIIPGESGFVRISAPTAPAPWDDFQIYRTAYAGKGNKTAQYYFFSLNGKPTADWKMVRGRLSLPWVNYCYFAKVQLGAFRGGYGKLRPETDRDACDRISRDFLNYALPAVLRFLPSAQDVEKLEKSGAPQ